jgi:hypothetical protein
LAYALYERLQTDDEFVVHYLKESPIINYSVTKEVSGALDGILTAVIKSNEIKSGSFGMRSRPVDAGYTSALGACVLSYIQEPNKHRGQFLSMIPDDIKGTKDTKRHIAEVFGKLRVGLGANDTNAAFMDTLVWLFNKWAIKYGPSLGKVVLESNKIKFDMVKRRAIPYKLEHTKKKGAMTTHVRYSSPRNIGQSPLLANNERTTLRTLARVVYYDTIDKIEDDWKGLSSQEQHTNYDKVVDEVKQVHISYTEAASKINARIFKRKKIFTKLSGLAEPTAGKKKTVDAKAKAKHMADITKAVFTDSQLCKKQPLATNMKVLLLGTIVETLFDEILTDERELTNRVDNKQRCEVVLKTMRNAENDYLLLGVSHAKEINLFTVSNQFGLLADDDDDAESVDDEGDPPKDEY